MMNHLVLNDRFIAVLFEHFDSNCIMKRMSINVDSALAFMNSGSKTRADSAEAIDLTSMVKHKLGLEPWSSIFDGIRSTQAAMSVLEFVSNVSAFQ